MRKPASGNGEWGQRARVLFDSLPLRVHFFLASVATLFLATGMAGYLLYAIYESARISDARSFARAFAGAMANDASERARALEDFLLERLGKRGIFFGFPDSDSGVSSDYFLRRAAREFASSLIYAKAPLRAIYLEDNRGVGFSFDRYGTMQLPGSGPGVYAAPFRRDARAAWGAAFWRREPNHAGTLLLVRAIFDPETTAYEGFFLAEVDESFLSEAVAGLLSSYAWLVISNKDREVFSSEARARGRSPIEVSLPPNTPPEGMLSSASGPVDYASRVSEDGRWKVTVLFSRARLSEGLVGARWVVLAIVVSCFSIALIIAYFESRGVSLGMVRLTDSVRAIVVGNLDVRVPVSGGKEASELAREFNLMTSRLQGMIQELTEERGAKQEAELRSLEAEYRNLQAQLDPHFLYNALEAINATAKLAGADEVAELTTSLGSLLRGALGARGQGASQNAEAERSDLVTLERELEYVRDYLRFAKVLHSDGLAVDFDAPDSLLGLRVPRFILQPLVENSLRHGFPRGLHDASIVVQIQASGDGDALITVADNGAGIGPEKLLELQEMLDADSGASDGSLLPITQGVGLRNIHRRIRIRFGKGYGVALSSDKGKGTVVSLRIPVRMD